MTRKQPAGTGRRLRWLVPLLLIVAWLVIGSGTGSYEGKLGSVATNDGAAYLPGSAESVKAAQLQSGFSDDKTYPAVVVYQRASGITAADRAAVQADAAAAAKLPQLVGRVSPVTASADGKALTFTVPIVDRSSPLQDAVKALRARVGSHPGLSGHVTGEGGLYADFGGAFSDIDGQLLLVAVGLVILVLLLVYRSPSLPFLVLIGVAFASSIAAAVVYALTDKGWITLTGQSEGVLSVLVVGATTDYSLLLISRYQEELRRHANKYDALAKAWRAVLWPVLASGSTVILAVLCLLVSDLNSNRSMGPVAALGIAASLLAGLTFMPAVLALMGRAAFWPFRPAYGSDERTEHGFWGRVAAFVGRRQRLVWVASGLLLVIAAAFTTQFRASGLALSDSFDRTTDSAVGQTVLSAHFPGGAGTPVFVIAEAAAAPEVVQTLHGIHGITSVAPYTGGSAGAAPKVVDGRVEVDAVLSSTPDGPAAISEVRQLRAAVHRLPGANAEVGGYTATNIDTRDSGTRDLKLVIPLVLLVILIVLVLLLRALVMPLLLVGTVVLSYAATMGVSALVFNHVFDFAGADPSVPLLGFVFLVAFGVDYNIFLMHRVREESLSLGTRHGTLVALRVTGGVITSAGVVLAATFAALSVVPMVSMAQQAFIVAFGVLLDTVLVRSLLVPALALELDRKIWWPSRTVFGPLGSGGRGPAQRTERPLVG
ncbi:MMPL family transporter [Streptacidiphilus sp. PB12-B1b]|uniref:MMPL family transporter n=1 Tax=Streptacidiphilus sp. PB12-B1b TaxID=2705012 RepID=UPI0015FC2BFB|nr:MMPL family transporter [Streptacidiphilus sp. PB12-B1b]QMU78171.1 MMPL family transporter [Streptacidiphilus sp. PB12-B1b]